MGGGEGTGNPAATQVSQIFQYPLEVIRNGKTESLFFLEQLASGDIVPTDKQFRKKKLIFKGLCEENPDEGDYVFLGRLEIVPRIIYEIKAKHTSINLVKPQWFRKSYLDFNALRCVASFTPHRPEYKDLDAQLTTAGILGE